jgi:hypothetical protein
VSDSLTLTRLAKQALTKIEHKKQCPPKSKPKRAVLTLARTEVHAKVAKIYLAAGAAFFAFFIFFAFLAMIVFQI